MMQNKLLLKAQINYSRLDKFLAEQVESLSRSRIQALINEGQVLVEGRQRKPSAELKCGEEVELNIPELREYKPEARQIPLKVLYEDKDIIVVDKPQGMVVHPSCGHQDDTLVNALLAHCRDLSGINGELRPGIVHRIDKDTSGVLIAAKNDAAHAGLAEQWKGHKISREYAALVCGTVQEQSGTVEAAIGRSKQNRLKMCVDPAEGRQAITHYQVLERFGKYTLLRCRLETGRTHQIRVHMAYLGFPVAGDPLYGRKKDALGHGGQYLHASLLGIKHPVNGKYMEFTAPLPPQFESILEQLRKGEI